MKKSIMFAIAMMGVASILAVSILPGALSAPCPQDFVSVSSVESPEKDVNQNGSICKYVRSAPPAADVVVFLDD